MKDCNYSELKDLWISDPELFKYPFPLDAWVGDGGRIEYGLMRDAATTDRVLKVMAEHGYRCSIVERLRANPDDTALLLRALTAMDRLRFVDSKSSADATADEINAVMEDIKIRLKGH